MGFIGYLRTLLGVGDDRYVDQSERAELSAVFATPLGSEVLARTAALSTAANLIAATLAKCEFRTFIDGKEMQGEEWYRWNVRPSANYSSSAFLFKLVNKLCFDREALVVETMDNQLVCADSFSQTIHAVYDNTYNGVTADDYIFRKTFVEHDVLHFRLTGKDAGKPVAVLARKWDELIAQSSQAFKRALGRRAVLRLGTEAQNLPNFDDIYEKLTGTDLKNFIESDNAVLPLYNGFGYEELERSKTYQGNTSRDLAALVEDVYSFTARSLGIPPALLKGDTADSSTLITQLLTFAVDPIAAMLEEEITAKTFPRHRVLAGCRVEVDTTNCIHVDVLSQASNADKLISSGATSVNEVRRFLRLPARNEPWANMHYMTRNYAAVTDAASGGGETSDA